MYVPAGADEVAFTVNVGAASPSPATVVTTRAGPASLPDFLTASTVVELVNDVGTEFATVKSPRTTGA